ncbi:MAG: glycyl-radical enzyme activating protein [Ruminococcaceae bacterium]|nr:glycyl-radical enzyme activating protein [Oscillospiraceae bacterium]
MKVPLIFDIKRTSTTDGPGIRTVVFFKGCNLDCFWCHNPEGKSPHTEIAYYKEKCIDCGECQKLCGRPRENCLLCGRCEEFCPANAKKQYGQTYSLDHLLEILKTDIPYYDATGGGVTFSGGECMLYPEYLAQAAEACRINGISVAIDTAGCVPYQSFEKILPYANWFLYDIKCLDPVLHRKGTGVDNTLILDNLERLQWAGARLIIRTPVIPHFNDGEELERIQAFCHHKALPLELLPYHALGEAKGEALHSWIR